MYKVERPVYIDTVSHILFGIVNFAALIDVAAARIRGCGIYESNEYEGGIGMSFGGGANLFCAGDGMNDDPQSNSMKFTTGALSSAEVRLPGTALSGK